MIQEKNRVLNIGIFAHVDAGKTTITENLLFQCGVLRQTGRVDKGNTCTDTMIQERERGISIQAAPISFFIDDLKVNLIDTPGHVDFVAEVERTINILDGAILVISAKEGLQSHTYLLFESLKKLKIPVIFFINKIDRAGCDTSDVICDLKANLTSNIIPVQQIHNEGSRDSSVSEIFRFPKVDMDEVVADFDEMLLNKFLNDEKISDLEIRNSLIAHSRKVQIYPLLFGSALKGIGMRELCKSIKLFLPSTSETTDTDDEVSWQVFKVSRSSENIKQIYIRVFSGTVYLRDIYGENKISRISVLKNGTTEAVTALPAGEIGIIQGLNYAKINDSYGKLPDKRFVSLGKPTLKYAIVPLNPSDRSKLLIGINRIAESDPYLEYELDDARGEIYLNLFGEIQMEIIKDILVREHSVDIDFLKPIVIYKETVKSIGESFISMSDKDNPFCASIGIRVEPNAPGKGNIVESDISEGDLPKGLLKGAIDGINYSLRQGLKGWEIIDTRIIITESEFVCVSTPADFRNLVPMVLFEAIEKAATKLLWPILKFEINAPERFYGKIIEDLNRMRAELADILEKNKNFYMKGTVPAEGFQNYHKKFSEYANGSINAMFRNYEDAPKDFERFGRKIYPDPLNKNQYLMSKKGMLIKNR